MGRKKYSPDDDVVVWESEAIPFKPSATLQAQVKQYKGSTPKLTLVETGTGYGDRPYSGYILKRVDLEGLTKVLELLHTGKVELERRTKEYRPEKE